MGLTWHQRLVLVRMLEGHPASVIVSGLQPHHEILHVNRARLCQGYDHDWANPVKSEP
jgi:hypothetical protein